MSYQGVWYEDQNGQVYCIINGQRVQRRTDGQFGSSAGSRPPSFYSELPTVRPSGGYPSVIGASSYPPRSMPGDLHQRYTSGIPQGRFGDRVSEGSHPVRGADHFDPYRYALNNAKPPATDNRDPPEGTVMAYKYHEYKSLDAATKPAEDAYKARLKTANVAKHLVKKDKAARKQNGTPRIYNGTPEETREWHQITAEYAKVAYDAFKLAKLKREEMGEYFVGYDTKHSGKGHAERVRILNAGVAHYARKYEDHLYSHGKPGTQPGPSSQEPYAQPGPVQWYSKEPQYRY